jgi:hypothetical protein
MTRSSGRDLLFGQLRAAQPARLVPIHGCDITQ